MDYSLVEIIQNQLVSLLQKKQQKFQWNQFRQDAPPTVKITVAEEGKMFTREEKEDKGLLWYKNLNFPPINVSLKSTKPVQFPESLKCQITVVKLRNNEKPEQSPLIGETEQLFSNGSACFSKLKFTQTSHKCGMCLFSFVITIFNDSEDASSGEAGLWTIFYSSPFEIEARQRTLPERVAVQKTTNWSLFNPFLPIFLDKQYEAKNKEGVNQIIGSDIDGMFMYLRSPIIRHKVFHPIFLLLKFRDSVRLFYNRNLIKIQEGDNIFSKLQRQIFEMLWQHDKPVFLDENKLFILTLRRKESDSPLTANEKQIIKYLKSLNGPIVTFMAPHFENFPKNFSEIKYNDKLIEQYREGFLSMALINFKRSKMNEAEKNLLLEFEAVSVQNYEINSENNPNGNNNFQKGNQQFFAQTIVSINNKHCQNRSQREKFQCISHKNLSNSPQYYQNENHYIQKNSDLCGKRHHSDAIQHQQKDEMGISEVREQIRKMTKRNEGKNQKNTWSPKSSSNPLNTSVCQDKDQPNQESHQEFQSAPERKKSNKVNKNDNSQQQEEIAMQAEAIQNNAFLINSEALAAAYVKAEKTHHCYLGGQSEGDLNKSSSPILQSAKQEQVIQTQTTIPQSCISQNSSQNPQHQESSTSDKCSISMNMSLPNLQTVPSQTLQYNPQSMIPPQLGMSQMFVQNQKQQPNPFFQMPAMYMYPPHPSPHHQQHSHQGQIPQPSYFYIQMPHQQQQQQQLHQAHVNNYYQDVIQKQQQIILEQQKQLEQNEKQKN